MKVCLFCGKENTRKSGWCSNKCYQAYYYQKNHDKLLERHIQWGREHPNRLSEEERRKRTEANRPNVIANQRLASKRYYYKKHL